MSYSICYGPTTPKESARKHLYFRKLGVVILVIFAIVMCYFFPQNSRKFVETLFPWTSRSAQAAFNEF